MVVWLTFWAFVSSCINVHLNHQWCSGLHGQKEEKKDSAFCSDCRMPFVQSTNHASCLLILSIPINLCAACNMKEQENAKQMAAAEGEGQIFCVVSLMHFPVHSSLNNKLLRTETEQKMFPLTFLSLTLSLSICAALSPISLIFLLSSSTLHPLSLFYIHRILKCL